MSRPPWNADAELEESLKRFSGALQQNRSQHEAMIAQIMAATSAEVAERVSAKTERIAARIADQHQRRLERWERRERRREQATHRVEGHEPGDIPRGIVFAIAAVICVLFAVRQPAFFWMVFVALGLGLSAATSFSRAAKRASRSEEEGQAEDEEERAAARSTEARPAPIPSPQPAAEAADPKVRRIQGLCDKLLAELESGPPIVREVVTEPRATIGGLRQACLETARRERELRSVLAAQDETRLVTERDALAARVASEHDAIVRERLGQALNALEQQLAHRAELATAASRLEAENTRILYTLENLHMQLLRARSTDIGAPELGGKLRDSLRELGLQIDAVAEALEFASAPAGTETRTAPLPTAQPAAGETDAAALGTATPGTDAERAERAAAARRAAQARDAQRH